MSEPITIGELKVLLKHVEKPNEAKVIFDFPGYQYPGEINSWRGVYAHPALSHDGDGEMTANELLKLLEETTSGKIFHGYKGGEYTYDDSDELWVANYSHAGDTRVIGIKDEGYRVVIRTGYHPY